MTTLNTVIPVEGGDKSDLSADKENEILSSTRIKQRRATLAQNAIPTAQLPRYLRDGGRHGNGRARRQSMPAQHIDKQPLPSTRLASCVGEINKTSVEHKKDIRIHPSKTPVKNCLSFPLDYRLQNSPKLSGYSYDSNEKIDISSESGPASPAFIVSRMGVDNKGHHTSDLQLTISSRTPSPKLSDNHQRTLLLPSPSDKMRRHSIAVSKISDCNRLGVDSPLPGMTDLAKSERSLCKSRDRIISGRCNGDSESGRIPTGRKMSRYVPKPDNHLLLSIFSCFCCPVIGLLAVLYSFQVDQKYEKGKLEVSATKSKNARYLALTAVSVGMMVIIGASMYGVVVFAEM